MGQYAIQQGWQQPSASGHFETIRQRELYCKHCAEFGRWEQTNEDGKTSMRSGCRLAVRTDGLICRAEWSKHLQRGTKPDISCPSPYLELKLTAGGAEVASD